MHSIDISKTLIPSHYLRPGTKVYVYPPQGHTESDKVWKLNQPIFERVHHGRLEALRKFLITYGFKSIHGSENFFTLNKTGDSIEVVFHNGDLLMSFSDDDLGLRFKAELLKKFEGTDNGHAQSFGNVDIKRDE